MLDLRPNCELCDRDLLPDSTDACICSYECTFCRTCVETVLSNVCPNCGGGFVPRPVRPKTEYRPGVSLAHDPPSEKRVLTQYTRDELVDFANRLKDIVPENR